jgi:PAS domain S-box-containing protein
VAERRAGQRALELAAAVLLLCFLAWALSTRFLTRKVAGLAEATRRFAEGDVHSRFPTSGPAELATLATGFNAMASQIASRQAALEGANRALRMLSHCNQALVRATSEAELLRQICRVVVSEGGYRLAWVGLPNPDAPEQLHPVAAASSDDSELGDFRTPWAETEAGRFPIETAARTGRPVACRQLLTDPAFAECREDATRRGYAALLALPLRHAEAVHGALSVYAADGEAFDAAEITLLTELADDLAYGLLTIRGRSERERAESELASSEALLRQFIRHTPAAVAMFDTGMRYLQASERWLSDYHLEGQEIIGRSHYEVFPDIPEDWKAVHRRVLAGAVERRDDDPFTRADGHVEWLQWEIRPWRRADDTIGGLIMFTQVITQRKLVEADRLRLTHDLGERVKELTALHRTAELLQADRPFDAALLADLAMLLPAAFQYPEVTEARVSYAGLEARTPGWRESPWQLTASFTTSAGLRGEIALVYREERPPEVEGPFLAEERHLLDSIVDMLVAHLERYRAERMLRDSEERFRQLTENIREVFWLTDHATGQVLYLSPGYERIWGYSAAEAYRDPDRWLESLHPEDRERIREAARIKFARGDYDEQYRVVQPGGSIRWVHARAFPITDATGRVYRIAGVAEDVTARIDIENQLRQSQKMEGIGQLAGGVAHDFNNILAAIMMQVGLARTEPGVPQELQEYLREIASSAERAANLTRQLLLFSRKQMLQPRRLDLNEVVSSLSRMLERVLRADVRLRLALHPAPLLANADAGMIDQVLLNLAVNARDAMPDGGDLIVETTERVLTEEAARRLPDAAPGRYVVLRVRDSGTGISPEHLPHIFEPFFTTKELGKGTGLGLATVFGIVKQHRGVVEVHSEVGRGTCFEILLPASEAAGGEGLSAPVEAPHLHGTETVLVVEDDQDVRTLTGIVLEQHGYRTILASNGVEGMRRWEERDGTVQVLLTDLVMPHGVTGLQLAAALQGRRPELRVIFTSGYSAETVGPKFRLRAGQSFLQKPYSLQQLLGTIRRSLDGRAES